jgi:fused signal recognition particle receptor
MRFLKFNEPKDGLFGGLRRGLKRTRASLAEGLTSLFLGKKIIDEDLFEELETKLIVADVGVGVARQIVEELKNKLTRKELSDASLLFTALREQLVNILAPCVKPLEINENDKPFVVLMIGVNGSGKTTTIGKFAKQFKQQNKKVLLAAGDTFRAAAIEQLKIWGERNNVPVIAQQAGSDSAAVLYDAFQAAKARNIDVVLADTAGRLHTKTNLMDELKKIKRILQKINPAAPHEILLVLDASTGQNALTQAVQFHEALGITGICLTKLDGTAKGGIIFAIAQKLHVPIRFIGVGEGVDDLRPFDAKEFVAALFEE